jgi:hypothetical protein
MAFCYLINVDLTNSIDQNQLKIPSYLRNQKVHFRVHKSPPLDYILNQMNPVHIFTPYFFLKSTIFSSILPSMSRSPKSSLPFRFFGYDFVHISYFPIRVTWPTHVVSHDPIILIFGEEAPHYAVSSSLLLPPSLSQIQILYLIICSHRSLNFNVLQ